MAASSEARFKDIIWCEHSMNAKHCIVCSKNEGVKPVKSKKVKKIKNAIAPLPGKVGPIAVG